MNEHTQNVAANVAATVSVPAWLISWAVDTLPIVQWIAGFLSIVGMAFAIFVKWQTWRKLKAKP